MLVDMDVKNTFTPAVSRADVRVLYPCQGPHPRISVVQVRLAGRACATICRSVSDTAAERSAPSSIRGEQPAGRSAVRMGFHILKNRLYSQCQLGVVTRTFQPVRDTSQGCSRTAGVETINDRRNLRPARGFAPASVTGLNGAWRRYATSIRFPS